MTGGRVTIQDVRAVGPDTIALELEAPEGFDPDPGQFVKLTAFVDGEHVVRFYTLSSPGATETFELTVAIEPDGTLGPWLRDSVGETVDIEGPYGHAAYDGEGASLILAGGPGIGAAIGVAEQALADGNAARIVYRGDDPPHSDRLEALQAAGVVVDVVDALGPAVERQLEGDEQLFVYGFQGFVTDALDAIDQAGGDPAAAKVENYG